MASTTVNHRGSYDRYKTRTKVFINWLTETARKCCKLEDFVAALKGRAGKQAKQNGEEILLTTNEIISLCHQVAQKEKMMIPGWILGLLKTVIARRSEYAAFYSALSAAGGSAFERSNAGHAHFIDILQQAHDIFAALDDSRIARRKKLVSTPSSKSLGNLFEYLKVEDGGDGIGAAAAAEAVAAEAELEEDELEQRAADTPRIKFKVKVHHTEKMLVRIVHLLGDLQTLREEIEDTFKGYICGEVTHEVACMVANIGFGLIRRTCQRFTDQHSEFEHYSGMLKFLGLRMERSGALVAVSPDPLGSKTSEETRSLLPMNDDTASLLCASGAGMMLSLLEEFQSPRDDHEASRHGFAQLLHDSIPDLQKLKKNPESNPAVLKPSMGYWWGDEFLSGIFNYTFGDQRGLPLWLAAVTQCYRNIHDILGGRMDCGIDHDSKRWKRYLTMIESVGEFQYCSGEGHNRKKRDNWSGWFASFKGWFSGPKGTRIPFLFNTDGHGDPPMHLIANLPTVTAGLSFSPTFNMYDNGYKIANTHAVIECAAHLYATCRFTKSVRDDLHWSDMAFFLKHHNLFTDTVPGADPYSMVSHFYLALGDRRSTLGQARAMGLKDFPTRWIAAKSDFLMKYREIAQKIQAEGRNFTVVDGMLEALAHCFDLELRHKSSKLKQKSYTSIELLSAYKRILIDDELERNFNIIGFSQQCSAFVSEIKAQLNNSRFHSLSSWTAIDLTASILNETSRLMAEGKPPSGPGTLLAKVSEILEEMVMDCGDKYIKEARTWSSD